MIGSYHPNNRAKPKTGTTTMNFANPTIWTADNVDSSRHSP